jgi:hypothetical protein
MLAGCAGGFQEFFPRGAVTAPAIAARSERDPAAKNTFPFVIPAKAGIQLLSFLRDASVERRKPDPGLRRDDEVAACVTSGGSFPPDAFAMPHHRTPALSLNMRGYVYMLPIVFSEIVGWKTPSLPQSVL